MTGAGVAFVNAVTVGSPAADAVPKLGDSAILSGLSPWADALATAGLIGVALGAGIAAAYGREIQAGRSPGRPWWAARILLLPLLAIGATAASEMLGLSRSTTAVTAAMLSLGGYDCLRMIEVHWQRRLAALTKVAWPPASSAERDKRRDDGLGRP